MNKITIMALLITIFCSNILLAGDTIDNRQAAAKRYLSIVPMESMMKDAVDKMSVNLPQGKRRAFKNFMLNYVRYDILEQVAMHSMVKNFTTREINALSNFYSSPDGQSAMKKMGGYMADVMPAMEQEIMRAAKKYQESN